MSMMNLQAFAISINSSGSGCGCRLLFANATFSSLKFTHFLKRFLQFNYFVWIVVREIHQRFTKYPPEVFVVLRKISRGRKWGERENRGEDKKHFFNNILCIFVAILKCLTAVEKCVVARLPSVEPPKDASMV